MIPLAILKVTKVTAESQTGMKLRLEMKLVKGRVEVL